MQPEFRVIVTYESHFTIVLRLNLGFSDVTSGKEPACQRRRQRRLEFDLWAEKIPGGEHGNPLQ